MSYVYPFSSKATVGRIDQGQDFGGTGAIYAIGDAKIIRTGAPGWPGGRGVLYQLLNGRYRGRYIFVYEGIAPSVRAGQIVKAGTPIGSLIPGSSTGIEIGFAKANGEPLSHPEYTEGKETVFGKEMARFLAGLKGSGAAARGSAQAGGLSGVKGVVDEGFELALGGVGGALAGLGGTAGEAVSGATVDLAGAIVSQIGKLIDVNGSKILLNIGLVGGGAFLIYYGIAKAGGVSEPAQKLAGAVATSAKVATAAVPK